MGYWGHGALGTEGHGVLGVTGPWALGGHRALALGIMGLWVLRVMGPWVLGGSEDSPGHWGVRGQPWALGTGGVGWIRWMHSPHFSPLGGSVLNSRGLCPKP